MRSVARNRANGKRYEGELVKILRSRGISARLGRSNEEADVILADFNVLIEVKSTSRKNFSLNLNKRTKDQHFRLGTIPAKVFYAIRYKGKGVAGWRFYAFPESPQVLYWNEGLSLGEMAVMLGKEAMQDA